MKVYILYGVIILLNKTYLFDAIFFLFEVLKLSLTSFLVILNFNLHCIFAKHMLRAPHATHGLTH